MKRGIKTRVVWSYLLLIIFSVVLFEAIIISALRLYYDEGVKQVLREQGAMFSSFYEQDFIEGNLTTNGEEMIAQYNFTVNAQIQLVDRKRNIIAETYKSGIKKLPLTKDVKAALKGEMGYSSSRVKGEPLLFVSYPLTSGNTTYGFLYFTVSLNQINNLLWQHSLLLLSIGGIVIILAVGLSLFLASTITKPITSMTIAAEQMAAGDFRTRIKKEKEDEIGRLTDTLNFMAEQVEAHEKLKSEFIASISHDLRTPLTSVKGWAVTLETMTEDEMFREGLEIISNESDRLNTMLNDLLDLSSLASGKFSFHFGKISIALLIHQVVQQMMPRAKRQGVHLVREINEQVEDIIGDSNRIKQVLINILDNALKFTPENGEIIIRLQQELDNIILEVEDTGSGIKEEELLFVKEKFYKGRQKNAGSGLGLAICEEIILRHKGSFELFSEWGKGTTVAIKLPRNV